MNTFIINSECIPVNERPFPDFFLGGILQRIEVFTMKRILLVVVFVILLVVFVVIILRDRSHTPPIVDHPNSIAELQKLSLGDFEQWILMRGNDRDNPVLLWLHGGPGSSQMPVAHALDKELEKEFIVVHYDQRGAGKSNTDDFDESTMVYEQFLSDVHELTQYLKERFNTEKIFILGHSWGTQIALEMASRFPSDYHACISVGQVVNQALSHQIAHTWLFETLQKENKSRDLEKLKQLGDPPYTDHKTFVTFIQMVDRYKGSFDVGFASLGWMALQSPEYSVKDLLRWLKGSNRGSGVMWDEDQYRNFNAMKDIPSVSIPLYFLQGKDDYNTPLSAVERYYEVLDAPKGKHLIVFESSAHTPFFAEPQKFSSTLFAIKEDVI